jgi:NAD(P)-dependent dehydrogenase (short-subunit alcohol dehydrogenase family)
MDRPRILVTGGAGYIGSHVCRALAQAGFLPIALDDLSAGHVARVQWGPLVQADVTDATSVRAAMAAHQPVGVVHVAGKISVPESVADPLPTYATNVLGTLTLLEALALVTHRPADILGLEAGRLRVGAAADLVLFDPAVPWKIEEAALRSKSKNTPFDKRPTQGRAVRTVVDGRTVFLHGH